MSIKERLKNSNIGQFWLKHEQKIILTLGIVLIAAASFEAGYLRARNSQAEPVTINAPDCPKNSARETSSSPATSTASQTKTDAQSPLDDQKCVFVASKNSNKFHLASCQFAQKIKPENRVCFASREDAQKRGYQGAKCCIK